MTANAAEAEKLVSLFHTGTVGPVDTKHGRLNPGQTLDVPEEVAVRLTRAYPHVKRAADILPGSKGPSSAQAADKAKLEAELAAANKKIEEQRADGAKLLEAAAAEKAALEAKIAELSGGPAPDGIAALQAALLEFQKASSKKDLEALQEKHKGLVPAPAAA